MSHRPNRKATLTGLALTGTLAVAGCSGSVTGAPARHTRAKTTTSPAPKAVATGAVEKAIATSVEAQRHEKVAVICPPTVSVAADAHFYCAAQAGGEVTPFLVTRETGGKLVYTGVSINRAPSVDMPQIEIQIAESMRADHKRALSVLCPQEMPMQQGLTFVCVITTDAKKPTRVFVHERNRFGGVSLKAS